MVMLLCPLREITRVGQNHIYIYIYIYGVYMVFLAGKSPYIRSYTVCIYTVLANPSSYHCCCTAAARTLALLMLNHQAQNDAATLVVLARTVYIYTVYDRAFGNFPV